MKNTTVGVDLAKEVIQVCIDTNQKVHSNKEMTHHEFLLWLFKTSPTTIIFEACGTSRNKRLLKWGMRRALFQRSW